MADTPATVPAGTVLDDKFRILRELGRGGMAAVYEAENVAIGKRVAVKILAAELIRSDVVRGRFLREARAAAAIRSPYVCDVYDSGTFDGRPFLVMELLEGESLYEHMTRVRRMPPETTLRITTQVCRGLAKAHELGVVHRDLKPENIFLARTPEGDTVAKIVDFGLAKVHDNGSDPGGARLTREGALFGTPAYMSPEQARGQGDVDRRTDLWALGCIVYECLTAHTVWNLDQGVAMILAQIVTAPLPDPLALRPDLPPAFGDWFRQALDRDVSRRFQTAEDFAASLAEALRPGDLQALSSPLSVPFPEAPRVELASSTPLAPEPRASAPAPEPAPRRSAAVTVAAMLLGGGVVAGSGWMALQRWGATAVTTAPTGSPSAAASASASGSARAAASSALEPAAFAPLLSEAQGKLAAGEREAALAKFKEAFNLGGSAVARSLLAQAGLALMDNPSPCKVVALGHPRPFENATAVSRPSLLSTPTGALAVWVDNHEDARKKQAYLAPLDSALRRTAPPLPLTPEADSVRHAQLYRAGQGLALLYWDEGGTEPGVYVRALEADGRIAGAARRLAPGRGQDFYPSLARMADGTFLVVWAGPVEGDRAELFGRKLDAQLAPQGEAFPLTGHVVTPRERPTVGEPDLAVVKDRAVMVYTVTTGKLAQVWAQTAPLEALGKLPPAKVTEAWSAGQSIPLSAPRGQAAQPRLACTGELCFAVWDEARGGAFVSVLEPNKGEKLWHRELAKTGVRPAVAVGSGGGAVAWFEGTRVRLASLTRDGLTQESVVGRVSGFQPYPSLMEAGAPRRWLLGWRDYESGSLEAYAARVECPE